MANILLCEPEGHCRKLLRYILEGIHHRVSEADGYEDVHALAAADPPDLIILGAALGGAAIAVADPDWQIGLPEVPLLLLFSGPPGLRAAFLEAWEGPPTLKFLVHPVEPYPLLAMVKSMLTSPETWRRGGQHSV